MSKQTKPSIVFVHGLWADGSCFGKLIPALQAEGHDLIAAQFGLNSLASDVRRGQERAGPGQQSGDPGRPFLRRHPHHGRRS